MLKVTFVTTLLSALLCVCSSHLCLISPPQRGSMMGLNKPGSPDCILLDSPCGGREQKTTGISLLAGQTFTVTFQKNLDHYNKAKPGYFSISMGYSESALKEIAHMPDTSDSSLTLYSANITMPIGKGPMVLQARYVTNNPQAPAVFYQCTDIQLRK